MSGRLFVGMANVKIIKPKPFKGGALLKELGIGWRSLAKEIRADFKQTVSTWKHKPTFDITMQETPRALTLEAETDSEVYGYIDKGTKVRRALMSSDWQSKTTPASGNGAAVHLHSGSGKGRMLYVSRKLKRKGIKARGFTKAILAKHQRGLKAQMTPYLEAGVKLTGHGTR